MYPVALVASYLIGSIPSGYLLVRWMKRVDIRSTGSGNIGATNVLRTAGPAAGVSILMVDILKGWVSARLIPGWLIGTATPAMALACGTAAVLGHVCPCFLKFRGGKGVATMLGALAGSDPALALTIVGVWAVSFAACRYVSVGSLAAAATIPLSQILRQRAGGELALGTLLAIVIIVRHRENVLRLLAGTEHRAWSGNQPKN